uniref:Uncharacterized protein n=1 Tax=Lotus japonicus TaxID=34305 RepID=I3T7K3_LOTJA|nr:unknown [Lotus japonicus]
MCRSTDYHSHHGDRETEPFTITSFFLRLSAPDYNSELASHESSPTPDSLTLLLFIPNNTNDVNETPLLPPYSPATVTLRRMRFPGEISGDTRAMIFGSKETVQVTTTQSLRFQLYHAETKILKGTIKRRRNEKEKWKLECCNCENPSSFSISEAEFLFAIDGHAPITARFGFAAGSVPVFKHHKNKKLRRTKMNLEDIPEETELLCGDDGHADTDTELEEVCDHLEMDLQVLRKSLDVGIWVLCLGVGFMVSRASITKFRSRLRFS